MRFAALLLGAALVTACGSRASQGPAWPKMAEAEQDGGESLAPRGPSVVSDAADAEETEVEVTAGEPAAASSAGSTPAAPSGATTAGTTTTTTVTAPEDAITIEEIVIEVDD